MEELFRSTEMAFTEKMRPCLSESDSPTSWTLTIRCAVTVAGMEIQAVEPSTLRCALAVAGSSRTDLFGVVATKSARC